MEQSGKIIMTFKCPKAFSELKPCDGGWYCDGCQKIVHDFRWMATAEIRNAFLSSEAQLCGMYNTNQVYIAPKPYRRWQRWTSAIMIFMGLTSCYKEELGIPKSRPADLPQKIEIAELPNDVVFGFSEINPEFPGGETAFINQIKKNVKWDGKTFGRIFVQFTVEKDGSLSDVKVLRSLEKSLDEQVIEAVKKSPKWRPGVQNGKPKIVQFAIPVQFMAPDK